MKKNSKNFTLQLLVLTVFIVGLLGMVYFIQISSLYEIDRNNTCTQNTSTMAVPRYGKTRVLPMYEDQFVAKLEKENRCYKKIK